jgi:Bacterial archaeo-eukaryotic release factor family 2
MHLRFLSPLYERTGPWASVYLDATHDTEGAHSESQLRWEAAAERLREAGCDPDTVASLERAVSDQPSQPGRYGLAAFAAGGEVGLVQPMPDPPRRPIATVGPLSHVMPLVAQLREQVPWLRVVVDHTGADLAGATAGGVARTGEVAGTEYPVRKVQPGGWSQPRYQRSAELTWERHATEAAEAVAEMADDIGAEVLLVAGDPQSRPLLIEHLPSRWQRRALTVDLGSRGPGADPQRLDDVTEQAVAQMAAAETADVIDRYRQQRSGHDQSGLDAAVAALQRGQLDTLLLIDDPSSTLSLWIGPEPTHLARDRGELHAMGVEQPQEVRADAALVRAIVGTGADLVVVDPAELPPEELDNTGVGVLLRYVDSTMDVGASGKEEG